MSQVSLDILIKKLDLVSKSTLERALEMVACSGHQSVELAHWVYQLLDWDDQSWQKKISCYGADVLLLKRQLTDALSAYSNELGLTPTLSSSVIDLSCEAWVIASLEYNQSLISPLVLLLALFRNITLRQSLFGMAPGFQQWDVAALISDCQSLPQLMTINVNKEATLINVNNVVENVLQQYTIDLTEQARLGQLDPVIGREYEIQQMIDILQRRRQNNPILTGEAGVGKTACVEGLAIRMANQDVPMALRGAHLLSLDLALLQAGASVKGEFEKRLKQLIQVIDDSPDPIILFIDEAHNMIGAGSGSAGTNDAANLLKPALARGKLKTIAATTWREYKKHIETDPALVRRFHVVQVSEPSMDQAVAMLCGVANKLQTHHQVSLSLDAIEAAVSLSDRYLSERYLPDKALSLLDTACARAVTVRYGGSLALIKEQATVAQLQQKYDLLMYEVPSEKVKNEISMVIDLLQKHEKKIDRIKHQIEQERILIDQISVCRSTASDLNQHAIEDLINQLKQLQSECRYMSHQVDRYLVADVLSSWTGVPVSNMLQDKPLMSIESVLSKKIKGQHQAVEVIGQTLMTTSANLSDPNRPLGVFLLAGPSGVGKTQTAHALADLLMGRRDQMTVINMSAFKEGHQVSTLTGPPPGYIGYGEGGVLTEAVRRHPYGLVLLDEMEKAHPSVQDVFYQMLDRGCMRDGEGRDIDFTQCIIIMTTNAADTFIEKNRDSLLQKDTSAILGLHQVLESYFKPAFLGRVNVIPYYSLSDHVMRDMISDQLQQLVDRVNCYHHINLFVDEKVIDCVLSQCKLRQSGARQIKRILDQRISPLVAEYILSDLSRDRCSSCRLSLDEFGCYVVEA